MVGPQGLKEIILGTAQGWRRILTTGLAVLDLAAHACCLATAAPPIGATAAAIVAVALAASWRVLEHICATNEAITLEHITLGADVKQQVF